MSAKYGTSSKFTLLPAVLISILIELLISLPVFGQEKLRADVGLRLPGLQDPRVPILSDQPFLGLTMHGARSPYLKSRISGLKREVKLDSTGRNINFIETFNNVQFRLPTYLTIKDYLAERSRQEVRGMWLRKVATSIGEKARYQRRGGGGGLRIDIPVEIKSKTFQKIFGGGTVGLDVTGDITIRGGFRHEKRTQVKTALTRGSDYNFKMEQTQRFRVQGHVGEKVTIGVDQDSERAFDFENNIRLKYEGYEDEIIQSIEAGNIALSLPGTRFVTFGGKSNGLFGIKTSMVLGNLKLTAIASQEKGEKKKMSLKGGASEEAKRIEDYNYKKGTYYFLDEIYRQNFWKLRNPETGELGADANHVITNIELYLSEPNYQQRYSESIRGWAIVKVSDDWNVTVDDTSTVDPEHYLGYFLRLEKNSDYFVHPELGYVRMNIPLTEGQVLAVAFRDSSGRIQGDINFNPDTDKNIVLKLLKTQNPRPSDRTWDLEWKNVYSLGGRNIPEDGFEVRIFFKPPSGDPQETIEVNGKKMTYLQVFGLDNIDQSGNNNPDNLIDMKDNIVDLANGELWFPDIRPFDPVDPKFQALLPKEKRSPAIYDTTVQSVINAQSKFYIEVKSKTRSSEYHLGMNIIENSEEVRLNGRTLQRGTDYTIDYFTGTLRLLKQEAMQPSANLDVTYESNQLFMIDKKTVMGARAEYALWDESFIGATFLYLNERTLDQKIRVGKGPMRNMVWDLNTSLAFKPYFLTRFANFLPFVDTRAPSSLKFEGEIAQVIPNPNTRNNENTNDNDGVAYIDDFEAAKRVTPITITNRSWSYCSPPIGKVDKSKIYPTLENRGHLIYYNPYEQYPIKWIWPNRDINANVAQTTNILTLQFTPVDSLDKLGRDVTESWNGIQKALSAGYYNQTESKFLEIWVKGDHGRIHIDLGQISEDIIPNKKLDTEDRANNSGYRNGILDDGEDIGIDGMSDKDARAIAAGGDFWDINGNGVRDWGEPFSEDNWAYNPDQKDYQNIDYSRVNGTEGNANDFGGRRPDTEDMNGNGSVDLRNDYFEYSFSLRKDSPDTIYISGKSISKETGEDFGWRQYRIPLQVGEPTLKKYGNPDFSLIEYIRVWFDDFEEVRPYTIQIAEINLVGSEWKESGVATKDDPENYITTEDSVLTVTVVNTHDNPEYSPPPGVQGEVDRITRVIAKEQALVLDIKDLKPGENAIIKKTFFEPQDYIHYNTLKMFVYGHDPWGRHITADSSRIEFFLRFGSDMNNYYEVRERVYDGWTKNNIEVDLVELSAIKLISENWDSTRQAYVKEIGNGRTILVKGRPALRNVRMLVAGVKNLDYDELGVPMGDVQPFTGQVWMNELRLSNVKKDKGVAMRARVDFSWADLIRFNGEINKQDADFHNVATRFGDGNNQIRGNFSTSIYLDKFLPSKLGISIPFNYNYARSEATPKYIPGTDVEVTKALPDSILERIRSLNEKRGFSISFSVKSRSQNFFVKHLLSRLRASYSKTESKGSDSRTAYSHSQSESGNLDWGINFSRENYFRPFKWLGNSSFLRKLADMKLFYTPQSISMKHAGTRSQNEALTRTEVFTSNSNFNITRNYATNIKIFESLSLDLTRNYTHDLRDVPKDSLLTQIRKGQFGILTGINQNFSVKYNPKLFSWLTNNFSYSVGFKYGYNRQQRMAPRSATQSKNLTASGSLNLGAFFTSIYRPSGIRGRGRTTKPGARPRPGARQKPGEKGKEAKRSKGGGFSVMGVVAKFFKIFEPISINYSDRKNMSTYGLAGIPSTKFQFGLSDSLGVPLETTTQGGSGGTSRNRNSLSKNQSISASSGFSLSRNIRLNLKYDQSNSLNSSTQTTGQRSQSWLIFGDNVDMAFPSWTLRLNGLEKLPFLSKYLQRVTLEHGFNGRHSETFNIENHQENVTKEDKDTRFSPLIGFNMTFRNGISVNVRYNKSEKISMSRGFGVGGVKTNSEDLSFTAQYSKRGNFRIPIPVWPFRNMRLKNNVDISITFSMGNNVTSKNRAGGEYEVTAETSKWFFKPNMTYSFSDRVRGGAHFEIGKTHNKMMGDSSYKEFGIDVNISIRGS